MKHGEYSDSGGLGNVSKIEVGNIGVTTDPVNCHFNRHSPVLWYQDIKSYCLDIPGDFPYPIIGDEKRELAVLLDMIDEDSKDDPEVAMTVRALYIIGPDKKLKLSMQYPASTGRNVDEILRVIDSLQLTSRLKVIATPANWT
ncbi:unnamed protein product, partial [Timema podura]|nr:unnamed protein product [Timema podura]